MKRIIILLVVCLLGTTAYAQNDGTEDSVEIISINGLELGGVYTREEIFAALGGQPDEIYHDEEFPDFYSYTYGQDVFTQRGNQFYGGEISSSRFYISKDIRVGDSIESINKLNVEYNDIGSLDGYVDKQEGVNSFTVSLNEFYIEPEIEQIPSNWFNDVCEFFSNLFA